MRVPICIRAYRATGGEIDEKATRFWEILGTLKWGIMCGVLMVSAFESGADPSIERGSIGRRARNRNRPVTHADGRRLMQDKPSAEKLLAARAFLNNTAMPQLSGHAAFHARVAGNVLDILARELNWPGL